MSQQYPDTPIPMRAPGPEDTDAVEQQASQRVDEGVDAPDREAEALDDARYDRGQGELDRAGDPGRDSDETVDDDDDAVDDVVGDLREGVDDVSDRVRQTINGDDR